ncbi:stage II sporulation protein M [Jeotgalibacillus aurantiacus]|uniref:stage II sporulation protein M n=1 Tax=Jeotgalibacillus aurantiacus TaxID=2763266 RepID=UPI001D0ABF26|nr:stage II sporulation protein M [Jeotgalibacillus aurantiacus]
MKGPAARQLQRYVNTHLSFYLFSLLLLVGGTVTGAILVNDFSSHNVTIDSLNLIWPDGTLTDQIETIKSYMFADLIILFMMWISGLTLIGIPAAWFLLYIKGCLFGFAAGFLVYQSGWEGIWHATGLLLPQNLLLIPVYLIVCSQATILTFQLWKSVLTRQSFGPAFRKTIISYCAVLTLVLVIAAAGAAIELIVPVQWAKWFIT